MCKLHTTQIFTNRSPFYLGLLFKFHRTFFWSIQRSSVLSFDFLRFFFCSLILFNFCPSVRYLFFNFVGVYSMNDGRLIRFRVDKYYRVSIRIDSLFFSSFYASIHCMQFAFVLLLLSLYLLTFSNLFLLYFSVIVVLAYTFLYWIYVVLSTH